MYKIFDLLAFIALGNRPQVVTPTAPKLTTDVVYRVGQKSKLLILIEYVSKPDKIEGM